MCECDRSLVWIWRWALLTKVERGECSDFNAKHYQVAIPLLLKSVRPCLVTDLLCSFSFIDIKRPITIPLGSFDYLTVLSMPQGSFEFLQIASLSRRRHGFDSRTGRHTASTSHTRGSGNCSLSGNRIERTHFSERIGGLTSSVRYQAKPSSRFQTRVLEVPSFSD